MTNALFENGPTILERRPRFEGSNICTWIGFKHVMYLVEEAILEHFRRCGLQPRRLFEEQGICVDIVSSGVRILHALHMDDSVRMEVTPKPTSGSDLIFGVQMFVNRDGAELKCVTGKVKVVLLQDHCGITVTPPANEVSPNIVSERPGSDRNGHGPGSGRGHEAGGEELIRQLLPPDANAFVWKWRVPYFYCHFTERMQHSGYLRLMEEVVDLFLANRGISIWNMLESRRWIPVVPNARLEILADALMEETIYTVYAVENIFKDVTYTSRMDCYVVRNGELLHTATGQITHGYAQILNRRDWALVPFDEYTLAALRGASLPTALRQPELQECHAANLQ